MRDPEPVQIASASLSLYRTALHLEYFTVGYNVLEAAASVKERKGLGDYHLSCDGTRVW
jgi:hypothetical protein